MVIYCWSKTTLSLSLLFFVGVSLAQTACTPRNIDQSDPFAVSSNVVPGAAVPVVATASANSWQRSDLFSESTSQDAIANSVVISSLDGSLVSAGSSEDTNGIMHWIVRQKTGAAWVTLDDFQYVSGWDSSASQVATESDGTLWVVGTGWDASGIANWIVRKKPPGGAWATSDQFQYVASSNSLAKGIAIDPSGTVYVVGFGVDPTFTHQWIVRSKTGVAPWTTSDHYISAAFNNAFAAAAAFDTGTSSLYVAGTATIAGNKSWLVRKLNVGSWSIVDNYQLSVGQEADALSIAVDTLGSVYATGQAQDASGVSHWITRQMSSGPWATIDDSNLVTGSDSHGRAIAANSSGRVYVSGYGADGAGLFNWSTKEWTGTSWTELDLFVPAAGQNFFACTLYELGGKILAGGSSTDSLSSSWLVRQWP